MKSGATKKANLTEGAIRENSNAEPQDSDDVPFRRKR
jgi:hypothetical protein